MTLKLFAKIFFVHFGFTFFFLSVLWLAMNVFALGKNFKIWTIHLVDFFKRSSFFHYWFLIKTEFCQLKCEWLKKVLRIRFNISFSPFLFLQIQRNDEFSNEIQHSEMVEVFPFLYTLKAKFALVCMKKW